MKVSNQRQFYQMSGKRLRRARRLWIRLIFEHLWDGGGPAILQASRRAVQAGLYAKNTGVLSSCFSITRHMYFLYKKANPGQYTHTWGWSHFWDDHWWLFVVDKQVHGDHMRFERWGFGRSERVDPDTPHHRPRHFNWENQVKELTTCPA